MKTKAPAFVQCSYHVIGISNVSIPIEKSTTNLPGFGPTIPNDTVKASSVSCEPNRCRLRGNLMKSLCFACLAGNKVAASPGFALAYARSYGGQDRSFGVLYRRFGVRDILSLKEFY